MVNKADPVSERVIESVAVASNRDQIKLPPLYDAIDADALDTVFETMSRGEITFAYAGYDVTVQSDGTITLEETAAENPSKVEFSGGEVSDFAQGCLTISNP